MATARIGKGGRGRPGNSASPVQEGRLPRINWTPERQTIYVQMKTDYDANPSSPATYGGRYYKEMLARANNPTAYNDPGRTGFSWPTFIYQVTGDAAYATTAYNLIEVDHLNSPLSFYGEPNNTRENLHELIWALDWLWPALTGTQQSDLIEHIMDKLEAPSILNVNGTTTKGFNTRDSDQIVAYYFAVILMYALFPTNPRVAYWWSFTDTSALTEIVGTGGVTQTASNRTTTARNAIHFYVVEHAEGGDWIESSDYNIGTPPLLLRGYDAWLTATGVDDFPEITAWLPGACKRIIAYWTPDMIGQFKWGDNEHPSLDPGAAVSGSMAKKHWEWFHLCSMLTGLTQGTPEGMALMDFMNDAQALWGESASTQTGFGPSQRFSSGIYNPYAPSSTKDIYPSYHCPGQSVALQKTGFDTTSSMCVFHGGRNNTDGRNLDHFVPLMGNFVLYKDGEWLIDHPQVYGDAQTHAKGFFYNSPLACGIVSAYEYIKAQHTIQVDYTYQYMAVTTGGSHVGYLPYFNPPPIYCHEWTRELFYRQGTYDTIVVFDRAHVVDPGVLTRYSATHQGAITNAPSRKQFLFHTMVEPTFASGAYTWLTPDNSSPMKWTPLLPATQTRTVYDLGDDNSPVMVWGPANPAVLPDERFGVHQVRIHPTNVQDFDTFLNVFQTGASPGAVTLVEDSGKVQGVHIVRAGESDLLILFNSEASATINSTAYHASHEAALDVQRFRETGFAVGWTAVNATTEVYLNDLNPANTWTKNIDSGGAVGFSEDSGGHATFNVAGTGGHTLAVVGS